MVLGISKMIATSGFLVALEWTKFVCSRGSAPDPDGGAYSAPTLPSRFRGIRRRERRKKERREEGSEKKREGPASLTQIPGSTPVLYANSSPLTSKPHTSTSKIDRQQPK